VHPSSPSWATAAAVAEHAIGPADVKVIRSILGRIPPHLGDQTRVEVEAELARHARTLDAGQLETLGKRILGYLDQDGRRPHDTPDTHRHLRLRDRDGGCELVGWLDREAPEIVRAALSPLAAPRPADTEIDRRTTAQRDADALVDLTQRALQAGDLLTEGGERPQVVVPVSLAMFRGRIGTSPSSSVPGVSHSMSDGPATPYPPRSAARSLSATADAPFPGVPYQPAGAKPITLSIRLMTVLPGSGTASPCAVATTNSSTIPAGKATWPAVSPNPTQHHGSADHHAETPSTSSPT
jgi:uncharacterized protein DUF222